MKVLVTGLASLGANDFRRAKPGVDVGCRRWRQDPALAALGRMSGYCPARRSLGFLASDDPETRGAP